MRETLRHLSTLCPASTLLYWGSIKVFGNLISSWYVLTQAIFLYLQPNPKLWRITPANQCQVCLRVEEDWQMFRLLIHVLIHIHMLILSMVTKQIQICVWSSWASNQFGMSYIWPDNAEHGHILIPCKNLCVCVEKMNFKKRNWKH